MRRLHTHKIIGFSLWIASSCTTASAQEIAQISRAPLTIHAASELKQYLGKTITVSGRWNSVEPCLEVDGADATIAITSKNKPDNTRDASASNKSDQVTYSDLKKSDTYSSKKISRQQERAKLDGYYALNRIRQNFHDGDRLVATGHLTLRKTENAEKKNLNETDDFKSPREEQFNFAVDKLILTPDPIGEQPDTKKLSKEIRSKYSSPAGSAYLHHNYERAAQLYESAAHAWLGIEDSFFRQEQIYQLTRRSLGAYTMIKGTEAKRENACRLLISKCPNSVRGQKAAILDQIAALCLNQKKYLLAEQAYRELLVPPQDQLTKAVHRESSRAKAVEGLSTALELQGRFDDAENELKTELARSIKETEPLASRIIRTAYVQFLKNRNRKPEAQAIEHSLNDKHCPICHDVENTLVIAYGYGDGTIRPGTISGGCVITPGCPRFFCSKDNIKF